MTPIANNAAAERRPRSAEDSARAKIMWLVIFSLVLPKGIGVSVAGNVVDLNKILVLLSVFLTARVQLRDPLRLRGHSLYLWLMILICLSFSGTWLSGIQYFYFAYYVLMYVSAFWVANFLFRDAAFFTKFSNELAAALILFGLLALLDHYFKLIPFQYLRPENESFLHEYTRGGAAGSGELLAYKGFDSVPAWFAMDRFIWASWSVLAYAHSLKSPRSGLNADVLMLASLLGVFEILLSQTRVLGFFALLLFIFVLAMGLVRRRGKKVYAISAVVLLGASITIYADHVLYLLRNIYSVFSFYEIEWLQSNLSYVVDVDKRWQALTAIFNHFVDQQAYLPVGPLFYNFTDWFLGVPSEYFDDLSPVVVSMLEIGFIPWMMVLCLVVFAVSRKKDELGAFFVFLLGMVFLSSIANFSPRFYYYIFFALGGVLSRRVRQGLRFRAAPVSQGS